MPSESTLLVVIVILSLLSAALLTVALRARRAAYTVRDKLTDEAVRWMLAQHYARSAVQHGPEEAWKPICHALAVAALTSRTLADLEALLRERVGLAPVDHPTANIWRAAHGDLRSAANGEGEPIDGADRWDYGCLREKSGQLLAAAQVEAVRLVSATDGSHRAIS